MRNRLPKPILMQTNKKAKKRKRYNNRRKEETHSPTQKKKKPLKTTVIRVTHENEKINKIKEKMQSLQKMPIHPHKNIKGISHPSNTCTPALVIHKRPSVDRDLCSTDVLCPVACKPDRRPDNITRNTQSTERNLLLESTTLFHVL